MPPSFRFPPLREGNRAQAKVAPLREGNRAQAKVAPLREGIREARLFGSPYEQGEP